MWLVTALEESIMFIASLWSIKGTSKENNSHNAVYSKVLTLNVRLGIFLEQYNYATLRRVSRTYKCNPKHVSIRGTDQVQPKYLSRLDYYSFPIMYLTEKNKQQGKNKTIFNLAFNAYLINFLSFSTLYFTYITVKFTMRILCNKSIDNTSTSRPTISLKCYNSNTNSFTNAFQSKSLHLLI